MQRAKYIYIFNHSPHEEALCHFEAKHIFNQEITDKLIFSEHYIDPSCSAFIRKRLDILLQAEDYETLLTKIKALKLNFDGFKIEYIRLAGDPNRNTQRLNKCRDIAYCIDGNPDYYHPHTTYALCLYDGIWYFSHVCRNDPSWQNHSQKPYIFSSSLKPYIAKALVNIAAQGKKDQKLIDACCGVGTVLLEACYAGYHIEGCDINEKLCAHSKANLKHYGYDTKVHHCDIADLKKSYDAAIVDLPYNLFCHAEDETLKHIINSATKLADRLVIVSANNISDMIVNSGLMIIDECSIGKMGKTNFERRIYLVKH